MGCPGRGGLSSVSLAQQIVFNFHNVPVTNWTFVEQTGRALMVVKNKITKSP